MLKECPATFKNKDRQFKLGIASWIFHGFFQQGWGDCSNEGLRYGKQGIRAVACSKEGVVPGYHSQKQAPEKDPPTFILQGVIHQGCLHIFTSFQPSPSPRLRVSASCLTISLPLSLRTLSWKINRAAKPMEKINTL